MATLYWFLAIAAGIGAFIAIYVLYLRHWHMSWGTIGDEMTRALPGDEFVPNPKLHATHAITINAPAAEIWPWLAQFGQGRGGWYSYTWLENLFGCQIENSNRIMPEFQNIQQGDGIKLHPGAPALPAKVVDPQHSVVIVSGRDHVPEVAQDTSFLQLYRFSGCSGAYILDQQSETCTRFIGRMRCDWEPSLMNFLRIRCFLEPAHSIMQEKMNRGIKKRVEAALRKRAPEASPMDRN